MVNIDQEAIAEAIREMEATDGWQVVKDFIEDRISDHLNLLEHCPLEQVLIHREHAKALRSVFVHIEQLKEPPTE